MFETFSWWLLLELIGLAAFPIAFRFFRNLPDRGYAFTKPLGLLLIAYPYWLLGTLGFLMNTRATALVVALAVAITSWFVFGRKQKVNTAARLVESELQIASDLAPTAITLETNAKPSRKKRVTRATIRKKRAEQSAAPELLEPTITHYVLRNTSSPIEWLRKNKSLVLATELVFTVAFFAWAFFRAYNPEITATEKPMEFAFLNGILQSDRFPPLDPWLSGFAISYYYFGYVIVALLTMLIGVAASIAFNLAIALLFALSAVGAFGLAYNLIQISEFRLRNENSRNLQSAIRNSQFANFFFPLFAPIFLVVMGNLEGFFETLHARGILPASFWNWLDVKNLASASVSNSFVPSDYWWWWRASRVIHDVVNGQTNEVIDEFPQFSFLLGDMHPHVLALPFVLLALAAALNLLRQKDFPNSQSPIRNSLFTFDFGLLALIVGALGFLNIWDLPTCAFVVVIAYALARLRAAQNGKPWREIILFALGLGMFAFVLYLPFYLGFQSQAGGILPVLFVKTRLHQYLLIYGFFVFILGAFVLYLARQIPAREWLPRALNVALAAIGFPLFVGAIGLLVVALVPVVQDFARSVIPNADNVFSAVLSAYFAPLLSDPWLYILLALLLAISGALLTTRLRADDSIAFVLLLAFTAFLLTFGTEFVFLRDSFGSRMNSVFKFYFQAWALLSVAAAYIVYNLARDLRGIARGVWFIAFALLFGASMAYPALAIPNKADGFQRAATLDGIEWIRNQSAGDFAAIEWLKENAPRGAGIVEAVGDDYSYGNRISMATGLPTILGWVGHELQWRGNTKLFEDNAAGVNRRADIARVYQTSDAREALTLLDKYAIKFVVVGAIEKAQYNLSKTQIEKFGRILNLVFENGDTRIYARGN